MDNLFGSTNAVHIRHNHPNNWPLAVVTSSDWTHQWCAETPIPM